MSDEFKPFAQAIEKRFREMAKEELYVVDAEDLFEVYLGAFPAGTNPLFRVRSYYDCSCCKNFVRNIGHVVSLKGGKVSTVWDVPGLSEPFATVAKVLADVVRQKPIKSIFRTKEAKYGAPYTTELADHGTMRWHHFNCEITGQHRTAKPEEARGRVGTNIGVFKRGLEELTIDALNTVIELIDAKALYRGEEHKAAISGFYALKTAYDQCVDQNLFVWMNFGNRAALFKNTVIGTLVEDLSKGVELDRAVRSFETKVAPMNYKRPTALVTPKMIDGAVAKLKELGLESAINRRFAKISDVSVNNVLFVDNSVQAQMKDGLAGLLMESVKPMAVDVKNATNISIEDFLDKIVPTATSIELLVENRHLSQFMSVTAPVDPKAGNLFKWDNGFAWSYDGDVADSIKQRVKAAGGKIDAALRVSLGWFNKDDLDLHVKEPNGRHIFFGDKGTNLDVDMNVHNPVRDAVENCVWTDHQLRDGTYQVWVNNYTRRETVDVGFVLEVEYAGEIKQYAYERSVSGNVMCLNIRLDRGHIAVSYDKSLKAGSSSQEKWGVTTQTLVPIDTLMASPNHWDDQAVGNKHWFFILKGCVNPQPARGIYNEFLRSSLDEHRKVFELLGAKTKCPVVPEQLSGVGFSSTRNDTATVVVKGKKINKAFTITF